MNFRGIAEAFLQMEEQLELFDQRIGGAFFWEYLRFPIHRAIVERRGLMGRAHAGPRSSRARLLRRAVSVLKNLVEGNPFLAPRAELLIWGCARRKLHEDGTWWDIYYDPIIEYLDTGYCYLEAPYMGGHYKPTRTKHVRYLDLVDFLVSAKRKIGIARLSFSVSEKALLRDIQERISRDFGVGIDIESLVWRCLVRRRAVLPLYLRLLARVSPKVVMLDNSYGREPFVEACKQMSIPCIELQHGIISKAHLGYSFPGPMRQKRSFPDFFFTFGDIWKEEVEMPIPRHRVMSVGYPYLELEKKKYGASTREEQILFISQGTIGEELSKLAVRLSKAKRFPYSIVYKLHPGEYADWRERYPWLQDASVTVVSDDSVSLYRLFAESRAQVGVSSTAVVEGLVFGLKTLLVDLPGLESLSFLVRDGYASVVSSSEQLRNQMLAPESAARRKSTDIEKLFRSNALENIKEAIEKALQNYSGEQGTLQCRN